MPTSGTDPVWVERIVRIEDKANDLADDVKEVRLDIRTLRDDVTEIRLDNKKQLAWIAGLVAVINLLGEILGRVA